MSITKAVIPAAGLGTRVLPATKNMPKEMYPKNDQAILEARIADLEVMVSNARVIEKENLAADTVHIGSSVFVKTKRADGSEAERSFSIVGSNEANPRQGKISDESAVGKALVGAKVGQTVEVETPAGIVEYTIISVS